MCLGEGSRIKYIYIYFFFTLPKEGENQEISFDLMNRAQVMDAKMKKLET